MAARADIATISPSIIKAKFTIESKSRSTTTVHIGSGRQDKQYNAFSLAVKVEEIRDKQLSSETPPMKPQDISGYYFCGIPIAKLYQSQLPDRDLQSTKPAPTSSPSQHEPLKAKPSPASSHSPSIKWAQARTNLPKTLPNLQTESNTNRGVECGSRSGAGSSGVIY